MKKGLLIILVLSILGFSAYSISKIFHKNSEIKKSVEIRQTIDWFDQYLTSQDVSINKAEPVVLIFFNPDCDYCQFEAKTFFDTKLSLENVSWFWISNADREEMENFSMYYKLNEINCLYMLNDSTEYLWHLTGVTTIPYILVYNSSGQLTHEFKGETRMEVILKAVR